LKNAIKVCGKYAPAPTKLEPLTWLLEVRLSNGQGLPLYKRRIPFAKAQELRDKQKRTFRSGEYHYTTVVNEENVEEVPDHFHRSRTGGDEEYKALGDALHRWIPG
jgi:hypothetical protein